jgi:uncharacterized protein
VAADRTELSPFVYERPLEPEEIIDRDSEATRLVAHGVAGRVVRLVAPRRYGKTTLLYRVLHDGEAREGLVPVFVDFDGVVSAADVAARLERAYAHQLREPLRRRVADFFMASGLGLSLGALGVSASLRVRPAESVTPHIEALLDAPARAGAETGRRVLTVFDEFQEILALGRLDGVMRSRIQHQGGQVAYIFSGSEPGMMRRLFEDRARPLYGQAVPERLDRLDDADLGAYIEDRFRLTGSTAADILPSLLAVADGHPQRAMLLAHELWAHTPARGTADPAVWAAALAKVDRDTDREFRERWRLLGPNQRRALRATVESGGAPYGTQTLAAVDLAKGGAAERAIEALIDLGELERTDRGRYRVIDPLFVRWLSRQSERGSLTAVTA